MLYDAKLNLEAAAGLLSSADPALLAYRRGIIERALEKRFSSGVKIPDVALHRLKADYLAHVSEWCRAEDYSLAFPTLRPSYFDGDSWFDRVRHTSLPDHVVLRHRLWTSVKDKCGLVDLIVTHVEDAERQNLDERAPQGAVVAPFSKGRGAQISIPVPEMRQSSGFDPDVADEACRQMHTLVG